MQYPTARHSLPLLFGLGIAAIAAMLLVIGGPPYTVDLGSPSFLRLTIDLVAGLAPIAVLFGGGLIAAARRLPAGATPGLTSNTSWAKLRYDAKVS